MMRDFSATYGGKNASTEDFRRVVEKHIGEPIDWFFNQWVYGTEIPSFKLQYQMTPAANGQTQVKFTVTQSGVSAKFHSRVPVYAVLKDESRRMGFVKITGPTFASVDVTLPLKPDKITLDETHSTLCESRE
jgi:aminopeptidase N